MIEQMKPSGVDYLGNIPATWTAKRFKYCAQICNGGEYADIEVDEGGYPVIGSGGEFARASKYCYQGESVLLGRKGTIDKPLYVNDAFWCVDTMFYTKAKANMIPKFLYYCALCFRFDYYATSTALPSMTQKDLGSEMIAVPPTDEQKQIAMFLDAQCSKLDSITADLEKQIDTLQKYKKSLITETVTKGLDKSVPMKDSGIEWIGQIPEHWTAKRLKYIMSVSSGDALTNEDLGDGDYPVFGGGKQMGWNDRCNVRENTILIGRVGANCGCVSITNSDSWATDNALIVRTKDYPKYVYYILQAANLNRLNEANAQPLITGYKVGNCVISYVDDREEQKNIANYLDDICINLDYILAQKQQQLETIIQHKKSLIYEYVTGKKRVAEVK